jgi:acetylornithine deacetylase/succinyl-diaminopimelate desuccinylase-like protein
MDTVSIKRRFDFDGDFAYGTGCCDAKSNIVSILLALEEIDDLNFGVAILSDEEENGLGSKGVVEEFSPRKALVMEPTDLKIAKVHYGSLEIIVDVKGLSAHGSTPNMGVNAIEIALDLINDIKGLGYDFSVQEIVGGSTEYVIADRCKFRLDFPIPPHLDVERVESDVKRLIELLESKTMESVSCDLIVTEKSNGFVSGDVCEVVEKAIEMAGLKSEHCVMPSWTDAINLNSAGWDVVVFGPGELHLCHTDRERVRVKDILRAKDVLVALNECLRC